MSSLKRRLSAIEAALATPADSRPPFRLIMPCNGRSNDPDDAVGNWFEMTNEGTTIHRPTDPDYAPDSYMWRARQILEDRPDIQAVAIEGDTTYVPIDNGRDEPADAMMAARRERLSGSDTRD